MRSSYSRHCRCYISTTTTTTTTTGRATTRATTTRATTTRATTTRATTTTSAHPESGPITQAYLADVTTQKIQYDVHQLAVVAQLDTLYRALQKYPPPKRLTSVSSITDAKPRNPLQRVALSCQQLIFSWQQPRSPKGLYIYGSVGVGKSYLMDLFYQTITTTTTSNHNKKYDDTMNHYKQQSSSSLPLTHRRAHFHEFMLDVHQRVHRARQASPRTDVLPRVAWELANDARLLCFDEFQVTDIADAMMLQRLFGMLWRAGVVVVATSNRAPRHLYEGGINRSRFLPFLDLLDRRMEIMEMLEEQDYRRVKEQHPNHDPGSSSSSLQNESDIAQCFLSPSESDETRQGLQSIFDTFAGGKTVQDETVTVPMGRTIHVTRAAGEHVAWVDFDELCAQPLGAADYLALCHHYQVLILDHVPQLNANTFNEARRFVTFIDAVYETKTKLVMATAVPLDDLFQSFDAHVETNDGDEEIAVAAADEPTESVVKGEGGSSSAHATTMIQNQDGTQVEWSATGRIGVSLAQLSAVRDVAFSFARAESRLAEMSRPSWGQNKKKSD